MEQLINHIKRFEAHTPKWVMKAREMHKTLKGLVYGDEFKEQILRIEHIEKQQSAQARINYSRPIKGINRKLRAPINFVYSATGGSVEFGDLSDSNIAELSKELENVRGGSSLRNWLQTYWAKDLRIVDPNGLVFFEHKDQEIYPTYKSIDNIRCYGKEGISVEWVLFEPQKTEQGQLWRIVTTEWDATFLQVGEVFTAVEELTFKNQFKGVVPAFVCSEIEQLGKEHRFSPFDAIIEEQQEYMRDQSILTIYKFKKGFPLPYRPAIMCPDCHGERKVSYTEGGQQSFGICPTCNGEGEVKTSDVIDEIIIPLDPTSSEPTPFDPNLIGFVSPDLETWNQYKDELKRFEVSMFEEQWGTRETEARDLTATGMYLNLQPFISELDSWSAICERVETFSMNLIGRFKFQSDNVSTRVVLGRNYIIQPTEYLVEQYQNAKKDNAPVTILDRMLHDVILSRFGRDPQQLRIELIKKKLEPYVHYDVLTVNQVFGATEAQKKMLFVDWWESLHYTDMQKSAEQLEVLRDTYFQTKIVNNGNTSEEV